MPLKGLASAGSGSWCGLVSALAHEATDEAGDMDPILVLGDGSDTDDVFSRAAFRSGGLVTVAFAFSACDSVSASVEEGAGLVPLARTYGFWATPLATPTRDVRRTRLLSAAAVAEEDEKPPL
ncbi:hypothetical protein GGI22_001489, partial [Coemansia erecta]